MAECQSIENLQDEVDANVDRIEEEGPQQLCSYMALVSRDQLLLNVTPQALSVLDSVVDVSINAVLFLFFIFYTLTWEISGFFLRHQSRLSSTS